MIEILAQAAAPPEVVLPAGAWEVGPALAALVIAVVTAVLTTVTVVINAVLSAKGRQDNAVAISGVKSTVDTTHTIVNSQRTEMTAELKRQAAEMIALKDQIRELTQSRDIARDTVVQEHKKQDA